MVVKLSEFLNTSFSTYTENDAFNTSVVYPITLTHTTTATPGTGIGTGLKFITETSAGNNEIGGLIEVVTTDVTSTSEDFAFVFKTMAGGNAATESLRIGSTGDLTTAGDLVVNGGQVTLTATSTRDKYRVWTTSDYAIGMQNNVTFGAINNDYAMTFQMTDTANRGFWWGDTTHTVAQGAMALSTDGKLSVAHSLRLGYGESDTTTPGIDFVLDVNGGINATNVDFGNVDIGVTTGFDSWKYNSNSFSFSAQTTDPGGIFVDSTGNRAFIVGIGPPNVYKYTFQTVNKIDTLLYAFDDLGISAQDDQPTSVFLKPNGLELYVTGLDNSSIYQYTLSTAWSLASATYTRTFSVSAVDTIPVGLFFKSDGTKMYLVGQQNADVYQYNLGTAWNISTATYLQTLSLATSAKNPTAITFSDDGSILYITDSKYDSIVKFTLSTAWDISSAVYTDKLDIGDAGGTSLTNPVGIALSETANRLFIICASNDKAFELDLTSPSVRVTGNRFIVNNDVHIKNDLVVYQDARIQKNVEITGTTILHDSLSVTGTITTSATDTATTATHYYVEIASDGVIRPKTLADVKTEIVTTNAVNAAAATTVGTVTSGTWNGSVIEGQYGGTGVANTGKTITLGGSFTHTGAHTLGVTTTANTSITLPTTGTLATTSNKLSVFASTSSSELAGVISDETGSGVLVFATAPTFTTTIDGGATFGAFASSTALTLGYTSTAASTTNISTGAVAASTIKAINIGTGGAASSTTNITIGSSVGGTTAIASPTVTVAGVADTATTATHYYVETTGGNIAPKTLADVKTEIVTTAAVNSAAATTVGTITSGTWNGSVISATYGGTGLSSLGTGVATWLGTPSSANLATAITDETGSGVLVFGTAPTFTTSIDGGATFGAFASSTTLTLGYTSTAASTTNISTGATASTVTKTINLGTGGAAGSTTNINIGSSVAGTTTISSPNITISSLADTATTATHYYVETASGNILPKTLANVKTEIVTTAAVNSAAATTVGTITSGVWQGTVIDPTYGGTGVNNGTKTITLGGNFTHTGAHTLGVTTTANTSITLPTTGTLATTSNKLSAFAATTSAELAGVISDETGSGLLVFATSPTLTTPTLGVASATSINKVTLTGPATGSTLTIADGKTLTASNTLTFTGTDASTVAFGSGGTVTYTSNKLSVFSATTSAELAGVISDETGSGVLVFGTAPTFTTTIDGGATFGAFASSTALTLGYTGTAASTTNISTGAVATSTIKTINIGTGAAAGSTTNINIGSAIGGTTTVNNNLTVTGTLTVNGTTTTVNSTTVTVDDPIFTIGGDTAPASDDNKDRGIEFRWHNGTAAKVGFFGFDDSTGYFTFIPDATNTSEVFSGVQGDIQATNFRGALIGNASTATTAAAWTTARTITLAGDLTGNVSIDGSAGVTLTATIAANSVALGTDTTGNYVATVGAGTPGVETSSSGLTIVSVVGEGTATTVAHADTSTLTGAQGTAGIAAFTLDGFGHVTAVTTATYLTAEADTLATVTGRGASTSTQVVLNGGVTTTTTTALTLDSGTTGAINIGTSANAKTITIGNGTGATSLVLNAGTGAINIGTNAFARTITIGNATGASALTLDSGTGAINIGTSIAKTITIGNTTGATATVIQSGTGKVKFNIGAVSLFFPVADGTVGQVLKTDGAGNLSFASVDSLSGGISNIVEDTTPQLGGNLDVNGQSIVSASNGNILITPDGTGYIQLDGLRWPTADGSNGYLLQTNGAGQLAWTSAGSNTTYTQSAVTTTGGAFLRLTGSDASTDDVKFADGTSITVAFTDANTITVNHADTSTLTGAQGSAGIAAFTLDGLGHVTAVTTATYLTAEADTLATVTGRGASTSTASSFTGGAVVALEDAGTNTVLYPLDIRRTSSGTPAAGIGVGMEFIVETTASNNETGAMIEAVTTDITATSEDFDLVFRTMAAGTAPAQRLTLTSAGALQLWNSASTFYHSVTSPATANRTITLPDGNVTLQTGTMALTSGTLAQFAATTSLQLLGVISDETGSGSLVFATSPTLVTPTLGVASATSINKVTLTAPATGSTLTIADGKTLTASNTLTFTGTDASSVAFGTGGTVAYTGGTLAQFAATTSLQLAGVISDETGSGVLVFATSPTFTTSIDSGATFGAFASSTALTLGYTSTAASTTNISTGAVAASTIKAINIGTGGAASSTTNITLGAAVGGTTTIASPNLTLSGLADTATAATHYYVETASGNILPKTLANVKTEIVTTAAVNAAAATTVGTVTSGTWSGLFGAVSGANLTSLTAGNLSGTIPSGVLGNSSHFIGTTSIALNRASATQSLTGINIDGSSGSCTGNAATVTNGVYTTGNQSIAGIKTFTNGTASTTNTTGSVVITGGLGVSGAINAGADVTAYATSDSRLKTNIENIPDALAKVNLLNGVTYNWNDLAHEVEHKDTSVRETGVLAQQVNDVLPEVINIRDNGYMAVRYEKMVPLLIEAIKELTEQNRQLAQRLSDLEDKN